MKRRLSKLRLSRKLTLVSCGVAAASLLVACLVLFVVQAFRLPRQFAEEFRVLGKVLADQCRAAVAFQDPDGAREVIQASAADPRVLEVAVHTVDGKPFARHGRVAPPDERKAMPAEAGVAVYRGHVLVTQPIVLDGERIGWLHLRADYHGELMQLLQLYGAIFLGVLLLALGVAWLTSMGTQRVVSEPILNLVETSRLVAARQDFRLRAPVQSQDEIGELATAFNQMLARIQEHEETLRRINLEELKREMAERRRAEQVARKERDRAEQYLEAAGVLLMALDGKDRILRINERGCVLLGHELHILLGADFVELCVAEPMRATLRERLRDVRMARERFIEQLETPVQTAKGQTRWLALTITPFKDEHGSVVGTLCSAEDVTERKAAEQALRDSEERFRVISMSAQDAIITIDNQGRVTFWNASAEKIFGYSAEEVLGQNLHELIAPERFRQAYARAFPHFQRTGEGAAIGRRIEIVGLRKDGTEIPVEISVAPVKLHGQWHAVGIVRDITDRKRAEIETARRTRQQATLAKLGQQALACGSLEEVFAQATALIADTLEAEFCSVLELQPGGVQFKVVTGVGWTEGIVGKATVSADSRTQAGFTLAQRRPIVVEDFANETRFEASPILKAHEVVSGVSVPIGNSDEPFGVLTAHSRCWRRFDAHDVRFLEACAGLLATVIERYQAEAERAAMQVQLNQAQKMESIGRLAAGIAHEINTPTQYIGDNIRFLQEAFADLNRFAKEAAGLQQSVAQGQATPEQGRQLEQLAAEVDLEYLQNEIPTAIAQALEGVSRVSKIVRAMKEFSHPGTEEKTMVDLNHCIESTVTVCRNEWKYVAELELDLDENLPPVPCLPGEFNQVVLNLVVNAVHAIEDVVGDGAQGKGRISISTRRKGDWVEVRVSDTGKGIPEAIRQKIFEPFFTTKSVGKGTGQGLALARSVIVDKHKGEIAVESEEGKGATFILRLPLGTGTETRSKAA